MAEETALVEKQVFKGLYKPLDVQQLESKVLEVEKNVPQLRHGKRMFGRQNSQHTSQLMSLTMLCDSPFRRMKQCLAQIERKTGALREAYFDMKKKAYKVTQWEKAGDEYSMIKAEEGRVGMASSQDSIEHAMREINMFQTAYEDIREQYDIPEDWDEADFEESEAENHIRMAFRYCIQRLMETNRIDRGTTEYLEQWGIHPMAADKLTRGYLEEVDKILAQNKAPDINHMHNFLDKMVDMFKDSHKDMMKRIGIKQILRAEATMLTHDHPDKEMYLESSFGGAASTKLLEEQEEE